jgi:hypothetical protein
MQRAKEEEMGRRQRCNEVGEKPVGAAEQGLQAVMEAESSSCHQAGWLWWGFAG